MPSKVFRLARTIGRSYAVDPEDTRRTKVALRNLGYLKTPSYGLTPYPDEGMFRGIEQFQDDFGLRRDGIVKPGGETESKLASALADQELFSRASGRTSPASDRARAFAISSTTEPNTQAPGSDDQPKGRQMAFAPAVPAIVYEIATLFGISVTAAFAWWHSLSEDAKRKVRSKVESRASQWPGEETPSEEDCEDLNRIDTETCNHIAARRGARAGARCHASASERYSACLRGRPRDWWPPLDTWNN